MSGTQALKRIPRIKFPQRHLESSESAYQSQVAATSTDADMSFLSRSAAPKSVGGKASLQPKRIPVSNEEIDAVLLGGCF